MLRGYHGGNNSGCHLHAARRTRFSRTFSTHIIMLSITSNIYLLLGIPGRSIGHLYEVEVLDFIETNIRRTTWNIHMCAVGYLNSSLNPQYPALRSFNRRVQWTSILGHGRSTEFVTRYWLHISNWLSTACTEAVIVADNSLRWTRWTMHCVRHYYQSQLSQACCRR